MDGWMDGRTDGWLDKWMNGCMTYFRFLFKNNCKKLLIHEIIRSSVSFYE